MDARKVNFLRLLEILPSLREITSTRVEVPGSIPLYVDVISRSGPRATISLSQYCIHPSGHVVADPSMIIAVDAAAGSVETIVFQNFLGVRRAHVVDVEKSSAGVSTEPMNQFLGHWLAQIISDRRIKASDEDS